MLSDKIEKAVQSAVEGEKGFLVMVQVLDHAHKKITGFCSREEYVEDGEEDLPTWIARLLEVWTLVCRKLMIRGLKCGRDTMIQMLESGLLDQEDATMLKLTLQRVAGEAG